MRFLNRIRELFYRFALFDPVIEGNIKDILHSNNKRDFRINRLFSKLNSHNFQIKKQSETIEQIKKELASLNQRFKEIDPISQSVNSVSLNKRLIGTSRLNSETKRSNPTNPNILPPLSPKEKCLVAALLEHKDMALSYEDLAKLFGNSVSTVKTQINQLKNKTDLLVETIDRTSRKRYKLKDLSNHLK